MLESVLQEGIDDMFEEEQNEEERGLPDNFSRVQPGVMNHAEIKKDFHLYSSAPSVTIEASH